MFCACGKTSYPSAAKAHEALQRHTRRIKKSKRSKGRLSPATNWVAHGKVTVYHCAEGHWHHGHTTE
jgi:hypothetical protein